MDPLKAYASPTSRGLRCGALLCAVLPGLAVGQESIECDGPAMAGLVTDHTGLMALPGASVTVRWGDIVRRPGVAPTDAEGRFGFCVPDRATFATVWAEFSSFSSQQRHVDVDLTSRATNEVTLRITLDSRAAARIVGRIFDLRSKDGVPAAAIEVIDRVASATSDSRGNFVMTGVPAGHYRVRISHLGYEEVEHEIEAESGLTPELRVGLTPDPFELEPIVISSVRSRKLEIRGFYERRYWQELLGLGTFYTQEDIERRRPLRISHMIADAPGIKLRCGGSGIFGCSLENSRVGCEMNAYIDGVNLRVGRGGRGSIDEFVLPVEVAGIEVYQGAAQLPGEYAGSDARCGAVVIWTR